MFDKSSDIQLVFHKAVTLKNRRLLKAFLQQLAYEENKTIDALVYIFCSDEEILSINQQFLQHDYYTDIITFQHSAPKDPVLSSDIYISVDTVRSNANLFKTAFNEELHRVIFHGLLHICGYKDKTKKDAALMRQKEDYYLQKYTLFIQNK